MEDNIGSMMADISRLLRRSFNAKAKNIGLTRPQWLVISVLHRHEGINQGGLAELLEVEPITLCRMIDRLQDAGLVERQRDPADRRAWRLFLTAKAQEVRQQVWPLGAEVMDAALEGISAQEREALRSSLDKIRQNLSCRPDEAAAQAATDLTSTPIPDTASQLQSK